MKDKRSVKKYIFIAVIGLTILFIWSNSFKVGDASMDDSNGIKQLLISFFSYFGINIENSFFIEFIRKIGHFAEYFILGAQLMIFKILYFKKDVSSFVNILFIGIGVAFLDETIQLIPMLDRSAEVADLWIDISGILCAFAVVSVIHYFISLIKKGKS